MKRAIIALALIGMLVLAGCGERADTDTSADVENQEMTKIAHPPGEDGVFRYVDNDRRVVCWVYDSHGGYDGQGGISCLPFSEVDGYGG